MIHLWQEQFSGEKRLYNWKEVRFLYWNHNEISMKSDIYYYRTVPHGTVYLYQTITKPLHFCLLPSRGHTIRIHDQEQIAGGRGKSILSPFPAKVRHGLQDNISNKLCDTGVSESLFCSACIARVNASPFEDRRPASGIQRKSTGKEEGISICCAAAHS